MDCVAAGLCNPDGSNRGYPLLLLLSVTVAVAAVVAVAIAVAAVDAAAVALVAWVCVLFFAIFPHFSKSACIIQVKKGMRADCVAAGLCNPDGSNRGYPLLLLLSVTVAVAAVVAAAVVAAAVVSAVAVVAVALVVAVVIAVAAVAVDVNLVSSVQSSFSSGRRFFKLLPRMEVKYEPNYFGVLTNDQYSKIIWFIVFCLVFFRRQKKLY